MSDKNSTPKSGYAVTPVIIQSKSVFNVGIVLSETNYDIWSQIMEMHIAEREKLSYIRGKEKQPAEEDPGYEKWYVENQKVKRWLLLSMSPEIMKRYLRLATAHEIWSALSKAFFDGSDELQVFTLNQKVFTAKQNGRPLSEYYGELMEIFQELDHRDKVVMKDPEDVTTYKKSIGRLMVHIFLAGLDGEFEQIRGEILRKEPVPELENSYALIRQEAIRQHSHDSLKQKLAGQTKGNHPKANSNIDKSKFKCTHCNQQGHTESRCFELNGYLEWWDHSWDQRGKNPAAAVVEAKNIDEASKDSTALMTIRGNGGEFSVRITNSTWIIDSGATDHMTFDSRQISSMKPSSKELISTANGDTTSGIGKGSLNRTNNFTLDSVLVVPSLEYNLLSDIQTRQTIGYGVKQGRLYYLDLVSKDSGKLEKALTVKSSTKQKEESEIWLWHHRLGHASFTKSHRVPFSLSLNKSIVPFMLTHSDVWGPSKISTLRGSRWFVTFIDDCTRMTWLWLMKSKGEVNLIFQKFHKMIETQYNAKVQVLRSDNGGEYQSLELKGYLEVHGIIHQTTCPNTPQQNGALIMATYVINCIPSSSNDFQTPLQTLLNKVVALGSTNFPPCIFGYVAFVHIQKNPNKLAPRALRCVFLGYAIHQKGYQCYHPPTKRMFISMDVVFHEQIMYFSSESALQGENHKELQTLDYHCQEYVYLEKDHLEVNCSNDNSCADNLQSSCTNEMENEINGTSHYVLVTELGMTPPVDTPNQSSDVMDALNLEALADPRWKNVMNEEMKALQQNKTWELVDCPPRKKPYKADDTIERLKARLVAKGYTQTYGVDYTETFAPVAKLNTVRVLLSLAFDVKNAFLHGELFEEVYIELPPRCMVPKKHTQKVRKLKKSLYDLKQSPRVWFGRFSEAMTVFGYHQSNSGHTLFLKKQHGKIIVLIIYVDDMIVTGNDPEEQKALQSYLFGKFEMEDLETSMEKCHPATTPIEEGLKLCLEPNQIPVDKGRYQRLCRKINYMHNPGEKHMNVVMHILRSLKYVPGRGILFTKHTDYQEINVYTNADWAGAIDDRRSTSGYFTFLGGNLVTWRSKKQNVVARSSAEAKFRGIALGLCEALLLKLLLEDLGYPPRQPI
ncbi:hypothetical protein V8G54_031156 [Vigna mungo]|uniref:Integrase catalytic domain-containing protein n=1 Tax=Vigna mungo TaxID=3915 RepID=A0AAQ3MXL2_VIGMU